MKKRAELQQNKSKCKSKIADIFIELGNVSSQSSNGQPRFNWTYDSSGNIYFHEDLANSQKIMYNYDSTGRLIRQTEKNTADNTNGYTYEYGYDLNNNVNKLSTQVGGASFTESYSYGKDNLPETYTSGTGKTTTYSYDNILRRTQTTINTTNPINIKYTYLLSDRNEGDSETYRTTKVGWEQIGDLIYKYEYDDNGNITKISRKKDVEGSTYTDLQQFHYDELNQLVRCDDRPYGYTFVYEYDDCGNMLSNTYYPLTWGSLDGVEPLFSSEDEYSDTFLGQLTVMSSNNSLGGTPLTYDEIGNPLSYWGLDLTWENGRELTSAIGSGIYAEYTYDSNGLRTSKKLDDYFVHTYKYINGKVCYEEYEDKKLWFFYDADGNPSHFRYFHDETEYEDYYYGCNWRGDVIAIFDSEGNLVGSYDYDAWGNAISLNDADGNFTNDSTHITHINPIRYRGYYCDTETGFYYLNSRYYDPLNHRFLNADNKISGIGGSIQGYNMFLYCFNNPVNMDDQTGNWPKWLKVIGSKIAYTAKIMYRIATSPFKAITVKIGAGVGLGVKAKVSLKGVPVEINAVTSIADTLTYEKGKFDIKNISSAGIEFSPLKIISSSAFKTYEHSYFDSKCSCNLVNSSFGEKNRCVANQQQTTNDSMLGVSFGGYLLVGAEFSIGIDLDAWNEECYSIYYERYSYRG